MNVNDLFPGLKIGNGNNQYRHDAATETTPENYRETWKPTMTPAEGHAWARAAGSDYLATVVHVTDKEAVAGIRGTGFNTEYDPNRQVAHEAGAYFALDENTASFYQYCGNELVSSVVVLQSPLEMDWSHPETLDRTDPTDRLALEGDFREAALAAAGLDPDMVVDPDSDMSEYRAADSAETTTFALKQAGYDGVILNAQSVDVDPMTGGPQLIVFDREQAVVIGTSTITPDLESDAVGAWRGLPSIEDAFAKAVFSLKIGNGNNQYVHDNPTQDEALPDRGVIEQGYAMGQSDDGETGRRVIRDAMDEAPHTRYDYATSKYLLVDLAGVVKNANVIAIGKELESRAATDVALHAQLATMGDSVIHNLRDGGLDRSSIADQLMQLGYGADVQKVEPDATGREWERPKDAVAMMSEEKLQSFLSGLSPEAVGARQITDVLQSTWAKSSSDSDLESCALQFAVADRFGVSPDGIVAAIASSSETYGDTVVGLSDLEKLGIDSAEVPMNGRLDPPEENVKYWELADAAQAAAGSPAVQAYVDATYEATQLFLRDNDVEEVTLYRGVRWDDFQDVPEDLVAAASEVGGGGVGDFNPVSSWSTSQSTAEGFMAGSLDDAPGALLEATVPAERIFSTPLSGPGCLNEYEVVTIGGRDLEFGIVKSNITEGQSREEFGIGPTLPGNEDDNLATAAFVDKLAPIFEKTLASLKIGNGNNQYRHDAPTEETKLGDAVEAFSSRDLLPPAERERYFSREREIESKMHEEYYANGGKRYGEEDRAIRDYTGSSYFVVNGFLRFGDEASPDAKAIIGRLDEAIARSSLPETCTLFRGLDPDYVRDLEPGTTFVDKGFVSTSLDPGVAHVFAVEEGEQGAGYPQGPITAAMLRISASEGQPALSWMSSEHEVILPRDSAFVVTGVSHYDETTIATSFDPAVKNGTLTVVDVRLEKP